MTEIPNDDQPVFVADEQVHCFTCFRLIRPGQTYYLTIEHEVLCADCALTEGVIRVREDLAVEVKCDRLWVRRGEAQVTVFPAGSGIWSMLWRRRQEDWWIRESKRDSIRVKLRWRVSG